MRSVFCRILTALFLWTSISGPSWAGAWLREHETLFIAASSTFRFEDTQVVNENAIYAEYGAWPKATLGFDYNQRIYYAGHALAFVRFPVGPKDTTTKYAVEVGFGGHHWQGDWSPMAKLALSMGRPIKTRRGYGWLAIDTAIERRFGDSDPLYKLDATLGLPNIGRFGPMLQIETAKTRPHPLFWTITPSIRYETKKLGTFVIGYESKHGISSTHGVKFSLWREF